MSPDIPARREALPTPVADRSPNVGLVLARYLVTQPGESSERHGEDRRDVLKWAKAAQSATRTLYEQAFRRRDSYLKRINARQFQGTVESRLIIGLGGASPLETGLTLHHTHGVPIIPGSALKGLAARYCDRAFGEGSGQRELRRSIEVEQGKHRTGAEYRSLFGDIEDAGHIVFHDSWIDPECLANEDEGLVWDVMTPHHGAYYGRQRYGEGEKRGELIPPTDFDSPVPIQSLSVRGKFHLALSADAAAEEAAPWLEWAEGLVTAALRDWGVGGKTSSGYGRLVPLDAPVTAASAVARPAQGEIIEVELVEARERRGGRVTWFARPVGSEILGPIQNSEGMAADTQVGQRLRVYVAYSNPTDIAFRYRTDAAREVTDKAKGKKQGGSQQRGNDGRQRPT